MLKDIEDLLQDYFDALYTGDLTLFGRVFHEKAIYAQAVEGELVHYTMDAYFDVVRGRVSPASLHQTRTDKIIMIDLAGPTTALAKVGCALGAKQFTDYLSLIKIEGRWKIMSKVFHYDITQ